jgi:hypothetical protein
MYTHVFAVNRLKTACLKNLGGAEGLSFLTLVIPRTPMLGLEEVEPFPVPSSPAIIQHTPSVKIPLVWERQDTKDNEGCRQLHTCIHTENRVLMLDHRGLSRT